MNPKQGDIYWVNIPRHQTRGAEQRGRKPFLVMSRDFVNGVLKSVVVVPLSTFGGRTSDPAFLASQHPFRIVIPVAEITPDPSCNIPLLICVAKTDQVRVIDKSRLEQKFGRLSQTAVISVGLGLANVFDIR